MIKYNKSNKYSKYIAELIEYQNQGENLKVEEFEAWKNKISSALKGNFKIRFNQLRFYTIAEETEFDDALPF